MIMFGKYLKYLVLVQDLISKSTLCSITPYKMWQFFLVSIGHCNIVNAVLQTLFGFKSDGVRGEVNLDIKVF